MKSKFEFETDYEFPYSSTKWTVTIDDGYKIRGCSTSVRRAYRDAKKAIRRHRRFKNWLGEPVYTGSPSPSQTPKDPETHKGYPLCKWCGGIVDRSDPWSCPVSGKHCREMTESSVAHYDPRA